MTKLTGLIAAIATIAFAATVLAASTDTYSYRAALGTKAEGAGAERYYVNVHTAKNAGGEIRGQLKLVGG